MSVVEDIKERLIGVAEAIDEGGNALLGPEKDIPLAGNPHATISQRLGQMIVYGTPEQKKFAQECDGVLTWISNNVFDVPTPSHCLDAIKDFPTVLPSAG